MSEHKWYAIQTYAGSEMAVKRAIENLVKDNKIEERLKEIVVPTEDVIEFKNGKEKISERSLYSGYVFGRSLGFASTTTDYTPCSDSLSLRLHVSLRLTSPATVTRRFIMQKAHRHCLHSSDRL